MMLYPNIINIKKSNAAIKILLTTPNNYNSCVRSNK